MLTRPAPLHARHSQVLLGSSLCAQAFCKLLGIGHGRFQKLKVAARTTGVSPTDGRFVAKLKCVKTSASRQIVTEYLEELYQTLSEPMPEVSEVAPVRKMSFRKTRGKRPKISGKQRELMKDPKARKKLRLLPPGTYTHYLQLLQHRHPDKKISLKLFAQDHWWQ